MTIASYAACTSRPPHRPVLQDLPRRVVSRRAHDAASGMGSRSAEVQVLDRRAILGPARDRPEEEELVRRELAVEDVPAREAELPLQIQRRQYLAVEDRLGQVRREVRKG